MANFIKTKYLFCLLLFINICFMTYFCNQKKGWFEDEALSYGHSNSQIKYLLSSDDSIFCNNRQTIFSQYLTVQPEQKFHYNPIMNNLVAHPPLYYVIFHTISSFFPNIFSKWIGLILNIVIFTITQIALYCLSCCFLSEKKALLSTFLYGFSVLAICTVAYIRNYMLFTMETTILCLLSIKLLRSIDNNQKLIKQSTFLLFIITLFCGCITHYYFTITAFLLCSGICFILLVHKKYKQMFFVSGLSILVVLLCPILFSSIINHLFEYERSINQSVIPIVKLKIKYGEFNIEPWNYFINKNFFNNLFSYNFNWSFWLLSFIAIYFIIYTSLKKKLNIEILLLSFVLIASVLLISLVMPLSEFRYFLHITPLFMLLFFILLDNFIKKIKFSSYLEIFLILTLSIINLHAPDFSVYLKTNKEEAGLLTEKLQGKTLFVKWVQETENWKMAVAALYSYSAKETIIIKDFSDICYVNMMNKEDLYSNSVLITPQQRFDGCVDVPGWKMFFTDWRICAFLPENTKNN